jgi:hypothetical protein
MVGVATATLAALFPVVGLPLGVGVAVIGLLYGIYHNARQRNASPSAPSPAPAAGLINEGGERRG